MNKKWMLGLYLLLGFTALKAQEDQKEFSDDELTSYASVMVWAEQEKQRMTDVYNDWINNNDTLEATKFVELKDAAGNEEKLAEINASEAEMAAFEEIQTKYDSMTSAFKETYIAKIKDDIGAGLYNDLREALKDDADVKARYEEIYSDLLNESKEATEKEEEDTTESSGS